MDRFASGLLIGWLSSLAFVAATLLVAYRRFARLQRRARQAERLAELGILTGGLAHEIKNPLSTVQLNLQLLREDILPDNSAFTRLTSRLATVQKETARLRDILDDFLRYAGKVELDPKPTDVCPLLEEMVDFYSPQAQLQRVKLRYAPLAEPLVIRLDERLFKQAILNLMINALQAMPETGGEILLSAGKQGRYAFVDVTDTGKGMTPEQVGMIFQAYYSTKSGGTGLGLAITQRIIEEHGGKIVVTSDVGKGSNFRILLPT